MTCPTSWLFYQERAWNSQFPFKLKNERKNFNENIFFRNVRCVTFRYYRYLPFTNSIGHNMFVANDMMKEFFHRVITADFVAWLVVYTISAKSSHDFGLGNRHFFITKKHLKAIRLSVYSQSHRLKCCHICTFYIYKNCIRS